VDFRAFPRRSFNGVSQELTEKEAMILKVLAEKPGRDRRREACWKRVWGYDVFSSTRTVDNFICGCVKRSSAIRHSRSTSSPCGAWGIGFWWKDEP